MQAWLATGAESLAAQVMAVRPAVGVSELGWGLLEAERDGDGRGEELNGCGTVMVLVDIIVSNASHRLCTCAMYGPQLLRIRAACAWT